MFCGFFMFTGLIEAVCTVASISRRGSDAMQLAVDLGDLAEGAGIGDSIAVNGVCLTVAALQGRRASFDISGETITRSTLGRLKPSAQVNVERALRPTDRLGGHIVQGHVDGTGTIRAVRRQGQFADIEFAAGAELLEQMIVKGSVAVDGISLTVAGMTEDGFSVAVIPQTLERTTLGRSKAGDSVNIETDIIVKFIKKQLERIMPAKQELTVEKLKQLGF
ncbi:MAG: riboflavin synthase [Planctomycetota bacterium]